MPRGSWSGLLKLSLVSCPIYLAPATSEAERIRLNMLNPATGNRIAMQPVDTETREPVERSATVKAYQAEKGRYVAIGDDELADIAVESARVLELSRFVERTSVDPLFIADPYFVYPDKNGEEAYRVIAEAMVEKKRVGLGRIVLSTREHPVMIEPFAEGLLMCTLRAPDEVRAAAFDFKGKGKTDAQMVDLAGTIMDRLAGKWEPEQFKDRYQEALKSLIASKEQGRPAPKKSAAPAEPTNVVDLMAVLKRSLAQGASPANDAAPKARPKAKRPPDRRQRSMLLPVKGGGKPAELKAGAKPARRRKAS